MYYVIEPRINQKDYVIIKIQLRQEARTNLTANCYHPNPYYNTLLTTLRSLIRLTIIYQPSKPHHLGFLTIKKFLFWVRYEHEIKSHNLSLTMHSHINNHHNNTNKQPNIINLGFLQIRVSSRIIKNSIKHEVDVRWLPSSVRNARNWRITPPIYPKSFKIKNPSS